MADVGQEAEPAEQLVDGVPAADRERAVELAKLVDEHQYRYYVLDRPTTSDGEYRAPVVAFAVGILWPKLAGVKSL